MADELISIVIPTFNRFELLNLAVQTVLKGTWSNIEIIIVNDKSTDPRYYSGVLEKYPKTRVIHLEINQKEKYNVPSAQGAVRQIGIEASIGNWIAFLDDDDLFFPEKLETQMKELKFRNMKMCCTNMVVIRYNNFPNIIAMRNYHDEKTPQIITLNDIKQSNIICNSTVLIHKSVLQKAGPQLPVKWEDWHLWLRALQFVDCLYISKPLAYYTIEQPKYYN